jgi:hypothetical protein
MSFAHRKKDNSALAEFGYINSFVPLTGENVFAILA